VQEAAYSTLLISRRQKLHQRIAETLQSDFAQMGEVPPELLAHHFTEAGLADQAIDGGSGAALRSRPDTTTLKRSASSAELCATDATCA